MTGPNLHLNSSMGCLFIGNLFAIILYGLTCAQVLYYIWEYPTDSWRIRVLVALLWIFDTAITIANSQIMWHYFIQGHSNSLNLTSLALPFEIEYVFSAITTLVVQCYYMLQIWRLLRKKWYNLPMTIIIVLTAVVSCACGLWLACITIQVPQLPAVFIHVKIPATVEPVLGLTADIYITVTLIWALNGERTGFKHTNTLINRLIMYAVNRGIMTALVQFLHLVTFVACSGDVFYWALFHYPGTKLYINSAIAIRLNARHYLRSNGKFYLSTGLYMEDIPMNVLDGSEDGSPKRLFSRRAEPPEGSSMTVIVISSETVQQNGVSGGIGGPAESTNRTSFPGRVDEEMLGR
ncbi:uncharacterized protein LAESUDRAFT_686263 [Laetiporus sulphureus 93-53]|uniref:DUF6534 domain-containing protein n=1 Tax=Laetiporus sulphureus 93-53 TaxID=1314785 RepID=A0A165BXH9_9APHY|nr:uncharacterized protein LAESUDRAFT_686263 [Laetiporus sulphureus 93-53]KZT01833.1 hypothetical protein LAESUDRAFT_686263 [Laetiporus sulphureus 93-53]